jgi:hypothetical protein
MYPKKLALTSPTIGGRSVGIVQSRTQATEFVFLYPRNRQWTPMGLLEVEDPTLSRKSAQRSALSLGRALPQRSSFATYFC